jgi:hypothetical protein
MPAERYEDRDAVATPAVRVLTERQCRQLPSRARVNDTVVLSPSTDLKVQPSDFTKHLVALASHCGAGKLIIGLETCMVDVRKVDVRLSRCGCVSTGKACCLLPS